MLNNFRIRVKAYINNRLVKYLQKQKTLVYEGTLWVAMIDGEKHKISNFKSFQRPELGKLCEFYDCDERCWNFGTVQACSIKLITEMERYECNIADVTKKR